VARRTLGLFTADTNLVIRTWDAFLVEVTGIRPEDALGRPVSLVLPELEASGLLPVLLRVVHDGTVEVLAPALHRYLIACRPSDPTATSEHMQQRVTIGPIREDGRITGVAVTIEDVTSRVENEKELAHLTRALDQDEWRARQAAVRELVGHGPDIVDAVIRTLREQHHNFNVLSSLLDLLTTADIDVVEPLIACLTDPDVHLRIQAALILGERRDPRAVPSLITALDDPDLNVRFHAIEALATLRASDAVEKLLAIANERDFFLAFPAIDALRRVGESSVAPRLVPLLKDDMLRAAVTEALGGLGDELVVRPLVALLNEPNGPTEVVADALAGVWERYEERYGAGEHIASIVQRTVAATGVQNLLDAVQRVGPDRLRGLARVLGWLSGAAVQRALTRLLGQPTVRAQVVEALIRYGPGVIDLLIEQLSSEDLDTRQAAAVALGRIGHRKATGALVDALRDPEMALPVAGALARIGDRDAFTALLELLGHREIAVRQSAIAALNSIGHPEMPSRIGLLLDDDDALVRESAVRIAGYFGYAESAARVLACCQDPVETVRRAAIEQLPFFEHDGVIPALIHAIERETPAVRAAAAAALARIDQQNALPVLRRALDDPDPWVRYFALRSIGTFGSRSAASAVRAVVREDPAEHVRLAAIDVLGRIDAEDAVAVLTPLAVCDRPDAARAAIRALGYSTDDTATSALEGLLRHPDIWRRAEALTALGVRGGSSAVSLLQWAAAADADLECVDAATEALALIASRDTPDASPATAALVSLTAESGRRETFVAALAKLPVRRAADIGKGLRHGSPDVRRAVIETLSRMKNPDATRLVESALDDSASAVRATAAAELRRLGSRTAIRKLLLLAKSDPDADVRRAAKLAVAQQRPEVIGTSDSFVR